MPSPARGVLKVAVIPGRREAASPESILRSRGYGFRARPFGPSRNDAEVLQFSRKGEGMKVI